MRLFSKIKDGVKGVVKGVAGVAGKVAGVAGTAVGLATGTPALGTAIGNTVGGVLTKISGGKSLNANDVGQIEQVIAQAEQQGIQKGLQMAKMQPASMANTSIFGPEQVSTIITPPGYNMAKPVITKVFSPSPFNMC